MSAAASHSSAPPRIAILLAFASVYLCWGATYTAMSIGVHLLPATILAGTRMLIGAAIMLGFCALTGRQLLYRPGILLRLALLGALVLHEHLQHSEHVGMVAVLCAVALVTSSQRKSGRSVAEVETVPLEREA
ncbi:MAG TPA: EamA family transporter [Terracidiphilus sp.]|nr:EamA family transporter [Terracidiphilus sp.]